MTSPLDTIRALFEAAETVPPMAEIAFSPDPSPSPPPDPDAWRGEEESPPPPEATGAGFPLNDIGNGRRFALYYGQDVMRVSRVAWYVWDGRRWAADEEDTRGWSPRVRTLAQKVSARVEAEVWHLELSPKEAERLSRIEDLEAERERLLAKDDRTDADQDRLQRLRAEIAKIDDPRQRLSKARRDHRAHAKATGNSAKIEAMLKEAAVELVQPLSALDADPLEINTETGVLRFEVYDAGEAGRVARVEVLAHDRAQRITKIIPAPYDPDAACPRFDAFLERIQPDPEIRGFLQRWFGLSMTGLTGDQKLAFFYGHGANGKSVLVDLMARIMGDYAATAKIESLTGTNRRGGGDATPDLIPLMGARMVRASEPEQGTRLQEGVIKELTGGEPLLVRALHSDFVEVTPEFKLTISGNHKPEIRGTDDGIWRRVLLTPFDVQIPEGERDPDLGRKLWTERAGILQWLVDGLVDYLEGGLRVPESVLAATREYREESDPMQVFLTDCCEVTGEDGVFSPAKDIVQAFRFWQVESGQSPWTERTVSLRLKDKAERWRDPRSGLSFSAAKRSISGYLGLRLTDIFARRMAEADRSGTGGGASSGSSSRAPDPEWDF